MGLAISLTVVASAAEIMTDIGVPYSAVRAEFKVPAEFAHYKGAPRLKGEGRGDLIATLHVDVPRELSDEQKGALEEYAKLDTRNPRETLFS